MRAHGNWRQQTCLTLALAGVVAFGGFGLALGEAQANGERFVMGIASGPNTFHPWDLAQHNSANHSNFNNRLVALDHELNPQPDLAHSWSFSEDGREVTLELREGVKFHSGKELTSEDVERSWRQITEGEFTGSHANLKPLAEQVREIRTPDRYTVELVYDDPNPAVFDLLDMFYIVDMDEWEHHNERPIGTGPFRLKEHIPGDRWVAEVNEDYFGELPKVREIEYRIIPDPQSLVLNLEAGSVDGILFPPHREVRRLEEQGFVLVPANQDGIVFDLLFGVDIEPFDDPRVRQAINHMINRDRFHRIVMGGLGEPRCLPWPSYSPAYNAEQEARCAFDPERAQELLAEAGYADGFEATIITSTQMAPEQVRLAEMLQSDLARIGVDLRVIDTDRAGYQGWYRGREFVLQTHNFGRANKDPASLFGTATVWKFEGNTQRYSSEEYERLILEAAVEMDPEKRQALYHDINEIILDDVFIAAVHTNPRWFIHSPDWTGISASVDGFMYFFDMEYVGQ